MTVSRWQAIGRTKRNLFAVSTVSMERMDRKPLALVIMLLIAGLAPASAIIGFCTRMPCCNHASAAPLAFATEADDCCTSITCFESPSAKLTNGAANGHALLPIPALVDVPVVASPIRLRAGDVVDTSPPAGTRHRLALLSILLI